MIKGFLIAGISVAIAGAVAVIVLFNTFVCTISFGLFGDCPEDQIDFQVLTEKEFVDLGEAMAKVREKANKDVDVKGKNYTEYKSTLNDEMMNEAEVHIRALYQTDWHAIQGIGMTEEAMEKEFGDLDKSDAQLVKIWKMAKHQMDEVKDGKSWYNDWRSHHEFTISDWVIKVQLDVYRCYLVGDESSWVKVLNWTGLTETPCEDLDKLYEETFGEAGQVVHPDDRSTLSHIHTISQETWTCQATGEEVGMQWSLFSTASAHHFDETVPRGEAPDCGEGYKAIAGRSVTAKHMTYVDLLAVLKAFDKYTMYEPGETVRKEETYNDYLEYMLRVLYDMYYGDDSLIELPGGIMPSNGWLVPMEEGTYYKTSPFGPRSMNGKNFHYGVDMATHGTQKVPIYATRGGVVVFANPNANSPVGSAINGNNSDVGGCGGYIVIQHDDKSSATYCHMYREDILVQNGWVVQQGQLIAGVGNNGIGSTGHHLDIKICLEAVSRSCPGPGGNLTGYTDPEKEPVSYILNADRGKATAGNLNKAVDYFNEVATALKKAGSLSEKQKIAQGYLMPGFTPGMVGSADEIFGYMSWKYETSFRPSTFCSSGVGDSGGISCGVHQMTKTTQKSFVNWLQQKGTDPYLKYYGALKGITTGTTQFANTWKAAGSKNEPEFFAVQEEYFSLNYWDPMIVTFKREFNVDLRTEPYYIREVVYSRSIQHGPGTKVFKNALGNASKYQSLKGEKWIEAVYNESSRVSGGSLVYFGRNSYDVQRGVYNRLRYREPCDAKLLMANPNTDITNTCPSPNKNIGQ